MSQTTYLDYTCAPNPLTEGATQDIIVIATLKTADELGIPINSATISQIELDFGSVGSGATQLTNTAFTTSNIEAPPNWTTAVSGATCTLTPATGHGLVSTNALVIKINSVVVNSSTGNVTLTVKEAATPSPQTSNIPPTTSIGDPGIENIILPKVAASETHVVLSADPASIAAGNSTTLNWSEGSASGGFSLLYINGDQLTTISAHTNGTKLGPNDVYPNPNLTPPDPVLTLDFTTIFVLQVQKSAGEATYVTTPVIVSEGDLTVASLTSIGEITGIGMVPPNGIVMFSGATSNFDPNTGIGLSGTAYEGWMLCNGQNTAPDLSNRFIAGQGSAFPLNQSGAGVIPVLSGTTANDGNHAHSIPFNTTRNMSSGDTSSYSLLYNTNYGTSGSGNGNVSQDTDTDGAHTHNLSTTASTGAYPDWYSLAFIMREA